MNGNFDAGGPPERDDLLAQALNRREIPDHGPDFWIDLNRAMVTGAVGPVRARDPRFRARLVGAAAMVALVAGAGALLLSRGSADPVVTAGPASTVGEVSGGGSDDRGVASSELVVSTTEAPATTQLIPATTSVPIATTVALTTTAPPTDDVTPPTTAPAPPVTAASSQTTDLSGEGTGSPRTTLAPPVSLPPLYDGVQPENRERMSVIGVEQGARLEVRVGPAPVYGITGYVTIGDVVQVTGESVNGDSGLWYRLYGYEGGWLPAANLAAEGPSADVADALNEVFEAVAIDLSEMSRADYLNLIGASQLGSVWIVDDDGVDPNVTIDVYTDKGPGVVGTRLYLVLGRDDNGRWALLAAESVELCARGVKPSGVCRPPAS